MFSNTTSETGSAGTGVIRLHRLRDYQRLRTYRVRIDGNAAGKIAAGKTVDFPVPPGEHLVRVTLDRFSGTRVVTLQVREGELAEFTCRPAAWWLVGLTSMMWAAFCEVLIFVAMNHPLWGWSALLLCGGGVTVLIRHRCIRLDGPRVTSRA
jgi:hypothetical protein